VFRPPAQPIRSVSNDTGKDTDDSQMKTQLTPIKFHPKVEELAHQLADFNHCLDLNQYLSDLVKREADKGDFKRWQQEQKAATAQQQADANSSEPASSKAKAAAQPNGVHPSVLATGPGKAEEVRS
jgi:hypothetical protein